MSMDGAMSMDDLQLKDGLQLTDGWEHLQKVSVCAWERVYETEPVYGMIRVFRDYAPYY